MRKILLLAIVLRLLVSAFYFHPDIKTYSFQASFLKKGVFNIYSYLVDHKKQLPLKEEFVYSPLTYLTLGAYQAVISPFLGSNFDSWLADPGANSVVENPYIFKYLIFLKLPYLVLDIAIAFLVMRFFEDRKKGKLAFTLWLFNPFTIILIYIFSNVDIFPVVLTLLSFLMIKKEKFYKASIFLGLAGGFKLYPLLFVPFVALMGKNLKEKLTLAGLPALVFFIISLPFMGSAYLNSALLSGLSTRVFNPGFNIGFEETIMVGLLGASALFFYAYLVDKKLNLLNYFIALFLIIFSFSHFHVAWLMWLAPFVVILAVKRPSLGWTILFVSLIAFLIPPLYKDRSMTISLFRVYSTLYDILPTPFEVLENFYDPYNLQSIFHSILAGANIVLIYKMFTKRSEA